MSVLFISSDLRDAWGLNLTRDIFAQLAQDYPDSIIAPIRHSVRAAEAPLAGKPIREHAPESTTASDYGQVAPLIAGA